MPALFIHQVYLERKRPNIQDLQAIIGEIALSLTLLTRIKQVMILEFIDNPVD